jgi:hypothetical protein
VANCDAGRFTEVKQVNGDAAFFLKHFFKSLALLDSASALKKIATRWYMRLAPPYMRDVGMQKNTHVIT